MFLDRFLSKGSKEKKVIEDMAHHIDLLCGACKEMQTSMEKADRSLARRVLDLEREGDAIRREIISHIYEGAFLPYLRPDLCRFVEIVDSIFDLLQETATNYLDLLLPAPLKRDCVQVAFLNARACEMLRISFEAMLKGEDLREKALAIRIYEKKIDDIKFGLFRDAREITVGNFWEGKTLSDFISGLTSISDIIEDAGDHLQIIHLSMK
jgi:hypothetical protein